MAFQRKTEVQVRLETWSAVLLIIVEHFQAGELRFMVHCRHREVRVQWMVLWNEVSLDIISKVKIHTQMPGTILPENENDEHTPKPQSSGKKRRLISHEILVWIVMNGARDEESFLKMQLQTANDGERF